MIYGSVCSGVEAATVAWHPLDWTPRFFSEIEKFPSAVLAHHYPDVPNHGDMTTFKEWPDDPIDLLVGGTPCQSFSIAGLRKGLDDPRGNLMLTYLAIAARYSPRWLVWENVPGVLSSNRGRDFGTFLGALGELGYGFAQRRRRVFVVGNLGDWRRAAAVLFERESLSGHPAPSREAREDVAKTLTRGVGQRYDFESETLPVAFPTLDASEGAKWGSNQWVDAGKAIITFGAQNSANQGDSVSKHVTPTLDKSKTPAVLQNLSVRRLTPRECERLQGFPDDYTLIQYRNKDAADGPRYKAMGNSMAVPVMRWIGERIQMVEEME